MSGALHAGGVAAAILAVVAFVLIGVGALLEVDRPSGSARTLLALAVVIVVAVAVAGGTQ